MKRFRWIPNRELRRAAPLPAWALLAGLLVVAPASVRADGPDPEWMIFLAVAGEGSASSSNGHPLALRFAEALTERKAPVIDPAAASHTLAARHSVEPKELDSLQIRELRLRIDSATMNLSLGDLRGAQRDLEQLGALRTLALDFLNREVELRQRALDGCLVIVRYLISGRRRDSALEQAVECRRSHPGVDPDPSFHPPDVRRVFAEASARLEKLPPATLEVESAPQKNCTVRLNGVESGKTPLRVPRLRQGDIRVQVECDEHHGRVHNVRLEPGPNKLRVDTELDAALRGPEPLWLEYPAWGELMTRAPPHAATLARLVGVRSVVLLTVSPQALWAHRLDVETGELRASVEIERAPEGSPGESAPPRNARPRTGASSGTADSPGLSDEALAQAVEALLASRSVRIDAAARVHPGQVFPWRDPDTVAQRDPRTEPPPSLSYASEPRTPRDPRRAMGLALAIGGTTAVGLSYGLWAWRYARAGSLDRFRATTDPGFLAAAQARENLRWPHLAVVGIGSIAATLAIPHLLPETVEAVPWWSWLIGGAGVTLAGVGIALWAAESDCNPARYSARCIGPVISENIGPQILLTAIPLLALPIFHLAKKRDGGPAIAASLDLSNGISTATLFGTF